MKIHQSYQFLVKPHWAPPAKIFGPIWTFLYLFIFISFGAVFLKSFRHEIPFMIVLPFILNLLFNALYTPLQFYFKNIPLATVDILLCLATLLWTMIVIFPIAHWITFINIPYLLWVSFATILQISILFLNK